MHNIAQVREKFKETAMRPALEPTSRINWISGLRAPDKSRSTRTMTNDPVLIAYTVKRKADGGSAWVRIGAAYPPPSR